MNKRQRKKKRTIVCSLNRRRIDKLRQRKLWRIKPPTITTHFDIHVNELNLIRWWLRNAFEQNPPDKDFGTFVKEVANKKPFVCISRINTADCIYKG